MYEGEEVRIMVEMDEWVFFFWTGTALVDTVLEVPSVSVIEKRGRIAVQE